jgi:hypothetical protein
MVLSLSLFTQMCRAFGKLLLVESAGNYSTDDDKHKARSIKNVEEGFVRKRHSVGGGYGSVMHMTVSANTGYIIGGVMNSTTGNDVLSLKAMFTNITNSRDLELDLRGMKIELDRGYKKYELLKQIVEWNGIHRGTHPRSSGVAHFPYTFGHPKDPRDIPEAGPSITRCSVRGTVGSPGYMTAVAHRDFKGSVVLLSTNDTSLSFPKHDNFHEWRLSQKRLPDLADTIHTDAFSTSDSSDESYDPCRNGEECEGDDTSADESLSFETTVSLTAPCSQVVKGRMQPSDVLNNGPSPSLVAYSDDDDDDGCSSPFSNAKPLTRLRRNGAIDTLEEYNGLPYSDSSDGEDDITATGARTKSDTDSDTTDEDDAYKGHDALLPVLKEKVVHNYDVPTREQLVNTPPNPIRWPITLHIIPLFISSF